MIFQASYWRFLLPLLAALALGSAWLLEWKAVQPVELGPTVEKLQQAIWKAEEQVDYFLNDVAFILNATEGVMPLDSIKKYKKNNFTILICTEDDVLRYWSNFNYILYRSDIKYDSTASEGIYGVGASVFYLKRQPQTLRVNGQVKHYSVMGMIPIYEQFPVKNTYLSENFPLLSPSESKLLSLVKGEDKGAFTLNALSGTPIAQLKGRLDTANPWYARTALLAYLICGFFYLMWLIHLASFWRSSQPQNGLIALFLALLVSNYLVLEQGLLNVALQFNLFKINFSFINLGPQTLGDWLLSSSWFFIWTLLLFRWGRPKEQIKISGYTLWFLHGLGVLGLLSLWAYGLTKGLASCDLALQFDQITELDRYAWWLVLLIFLLSFSIFNLLKYWFSFVEFDLSLSRRIGLSLLLSLVSLVLAWFYAWEAWTSFGLLAILAWILLQYHAAYRPAVSLLQVSFWLLWFAAFLALIIEWDLLRRDWAERQAFARQTAEERDLQLEERFKTLRESMQADGFYPLYFTNPIFPSLKAQEHSLLNYLDNNFFGNYSYSVHFYQDNQAYKSEKRNLDELKLLRNIGQKTLDSCLYFCSFQDGGYAYLAEVPIYSQIGDELGRVYFELRPKAAYQRRGVYLELLALPRGREEELSRNYQYALYKQDRRVSQRGEDFLGYLPYGMEEAPSDSFSLTTMNNKRFGIYKTNNQQLCLIDLPSFDWQGFITSFSYLFCIAAFFVLSLFTLHNLGHQLGKISPWLHFEISLKERIQRGIVLVSILSFLTIALVTVFYFQYEYSSYHRERLREKITTIAQSILWQFQNEDESLILPDARGLADIHQIDVNIYNDQGELIKSSEETVFERRLISRQIDPVALYKMFSERLPEYIQDERIGGLSYLSAYVPLLNKDKEIIAIINLPYDLAGNANLRYRDVANFLGTLLNVYVMLLLIAGFIAFLIAGSIANPLLVIGQKLNQVKLGEKSDPLQWKAEDEIGTLVKQYNHMIAALESSTAELARSQRESAWRDMAKQVAHEIKNPLTPMKLRLQMLQRLLKQQSPKANEKADEVMNALILQIDGLAHIASEFSNFAQMPAPDNRLFMLNQMLLSVYEVFRESENVQIEVSVPQTPVQVFADEKQILRVLNNLVKNAVQAIPSERQGHIRLSLEIDLDENCARICVQDNGEGIPAERSQDIFVPNFTTKSSGSGIGLSMSKSIVQMAKGRIYFESELQVGTRFFVELPLAQAS